MFEFHDPGRLRDGDLELVLSETRPGDALRSQVPGYRFHLMVDGQSGPVGDIALRIGNTLHIVRYIGHIGYGVLPAHRGHRYAARACRLLLPLAHRHGLRTLWITCNPDNFASRRTCELAGAKLIEIVNVPRNSELYRRGEPQKCRYRLET